MDRTTTSRRSLAAVTLVSGLSRIVSPLTLVETAVGQVASMAAALEALREH